MTAKGDDRGLRQVLADMLEANIDQLAPELGPAQMPTWDSLRHLQIMLVIEEQFGVRVPGPDVEKLITIGAIETYVRERWA